MYKFLMTIVSIWIGGLVVGPGALKPSVGNGIKSRRPLFSIIEINFFCLSFFFVCTCLGEYDNNNWASAASPY